MTKAQVNYLNIAKATDYRDLIMDLGIPAQDIFISPYGSESRLAVCYMHIVHGDWVIDTDWLTTTQETESFMEALTDGLKIAAPF